MFAEKGTVIYDAEEGFDEESISTAGQKSVRVWSHEIFFENVVYILSKM